MVKLINVCLLFFKASIDLDAPSTVLGDVIYTVQIFDDENDTVTFNMTTEPSEASFEINQSMFYFNLFFR